MEENYSPYCKICDACGEDGCCSALACKQDKDGDYSGTYIKDLKFGYLMYKDVWDLIKDEEGKKKLDELFNKNYELIYNQK